MKNILVINYSQTGQLDEILENFLTPFKDFDIERLKIYPKNEFPFPWSSEVFFDKMPETVLEQPIDLEPFELKREKYDLIIIGYQPWFLSPSLPVTALLTDPKFKPILKNTPVATVIGARNMWINSQKSIVRWIEEADGILVANIPFCDKVQNHISALTILHWMLTGKKNKKWGILPLPGIKQSDIDAAEIYGQPLAAAAKNANFDGVQKEILDKGGIYIESSIILIESRAKKLFRMWAKLIKRKGTTPEKRAFWVSFFKWYLLIALFVISPPVVFIHTLLKPLLRSNIKQNQRRYLYLGIKNKPAIKGSVAI